MTNSYSPCSIVWEQASHWGKKEKIIGVGEKKKNCRAKRAEK